MPISCPCPGHAPAPKSRRDFLQSAGIGFGWLALSGLLAERSRAEARGQRPQPHHPPRAKNVIFCFMDGGPSHVDTFDYKPELAKRQGEKIGAGAVTKLSQSTA